MRSNLSALSPKCREHVQSVPAYRADACEKDAAKLCKSVPAGKLGRYNCLVKNMKVLNADCRASIVKMEACKKPLTDLCPAVDLPLGNIQYCLYQNRADIGEACGKSAGLPYEVHTICQEDVKSSGCKLIAHNGKLDIRECVWVEREKMSDVCLRSYLKRPPRVNQDMAGNHRNIAVQELLESRKKKGAK